MIKVTCSSFLEDFSLDVYPSISAGKLKDRISGVTYVDLHCFRLAFDGKPLYLSTKLNELKNYREGLKIRIDFNKTDYARKQVVRYAKRIHKIVKESPLSLKEQLLIQEDNFIKEGIKEKFEALPEKPQSKSMFKKIFKQDTTSPEAQMKQHVKKRAKVIERALEDAYKVIPEFYTDCGLIYVNAKINGVSLKVAIDSGADITVMLLQTAHKCGLKDLIDPRYAGKVTGLGSFTNMGRVHHTKFEMGSFSSFFRLAVITSGSCEVLIGLDFLRCFGVNVNVAKNQLEFKTGEIVKFLSFEENPPAVPPAPVLDTLISAFSGNMNLNM